MALPTMTVPARQRPRDMRPKITRLVITHSPTRLGAAGFFGENSTLHVARWILFAVLLLGLNRDEHLSVRSCLGKCPGQILDSNDCCPIAHILCFLLRLVLDIPAKDSVTLEIGGR